MLGKNKRIKKQRVLTNTIGYVQRSDAHAFMQYGQKDDYI